METRDINKRSKNLKKGNYDFSRTKDSCNLPLPSTRSTHLTLLDCYSEVY